MSTFTLIVYAVRWICLSFAVWVAAWLIGGIRYGDWGDIFLVALVLGLLNIYVKPLFTLLSLPLTVLTLGLFMLVLNAAFLALASWLAGELGVDFHVEDFWAALFGAIVISIVGVMVGWFIKPEQIARDLTRL